MEKLVIETIYLNYYSGSGHDDPERWEARTVGLNGVTKIDEHPAHGDGDKWYWDVHYENNTVERIFYPHQIFYSKQ